MVIPATYLFFFIVYIAKPPTIPPDVRRTESPPRQSTLNTKSPLYLNIANTVCHIIFMSTHNDCLSTYFKLRFSLSGIIS